MKVLRTAAGLRAALEARPGPLGFVPTMGALHEGHLSLVQAARARSATVVLSIFVNPMQFGPAEDYSRYPRDLEGDRRLCEAAGVDLLFAPEVPEIYPPGFATAVEVERLGERLCGKSRPGHFRGVATVVLKLLNLVRPDRAYFGQKDFQQTVVVRRMVRDLGVPCLVEVVPTVREPDGLAMSSRNRYLEAAQRSAAPVLHRALQRIAEHARLGELDVETLLKAGREVLDTEPAVQLEYLEIVSADTLEPLLHLDGAAAALIAARLGTTRLIDNLALDQGE